MNGTHSPVKSRSDNHEPSPISSPVVVRKGLKDWYKHKYEETQEKLRESNKRLLEVSNTSITLEH